MTDKQQIVKRESEAPVAREAPETQALAAVDRDAIFVPDVDIREDGDSIRLEADMPGVTQDAVEVGVENGVLTIEGRSRLEAPEGCELVGQEYGVGRFRRDFTLSDSVDTDGIKARVRQGVLEITLPKHARVKTRKVRIEV